MAAVVPKQELPEVTVGVLVFQGSFLEHQKKLEQVSKLLSNQVKIAVVAVKEPESIHTLNGLVIPGGESTTMGIFLKKSQFDQVLRKWIKDKPGVVWGTCAGLILLANRVEGQKEGGQSLIGGLGITASRNLYGRQVSSFETTVMLKEPALFARPTSTALPVPGGLKNNECHGVFIRAPGIKSVDESDVRILATIEDNVVGVQQGNLMVTAFHPELTEDLRWHLYFVQTVLQCLRIEINILQGN